MAEIEEKELYQVFRKAIESEKESYEFYIKASELAGQDSKLKDMFLHLANAEKRHEENLIEAYSEFKKTLDEESWP